MWRTALKTGCSVAAGFVGGSVVFVTYLAKTDPVAYHRIFADDVTVKWNNLSPDDRTKLNEDFCTGSISREARTMRVFRPFAPYPHLVSELEVGPGLTRVGSQWKAVFPDGTSQPIRTHSWSSCLADLLTAFRK